jgi:hypothetical protein
VECVLFKQVTNLIFTSSLIFSCFTLFAAADESTTLNLTPNKEEKLSIPFKAGSRRSLEVSNPHGSLSIRGGDVQDITLSATYLGSGTVYPLSVIHSDSSIRLSMENPSENATDIVNVSLEVPHALLNQITIMTGEASLSFEDLSTVDSITIYAMSSLESTFTRVESGSYEINFGSGDLNFISSSGQASIISEYETLHTDINSSEQWHRTFGVASIIEEDRNPISVNSTETETETPFEISISHKTSNEFRFGRILLGSKNSFVVACSIQ